MANTPKPPSAEELVKLRRYTIDTAAGKVYNAQGKEVGSIGQDGYYRIWIYTKTTSRAFRRCHIIYWAHHGKWPEQELDHENRIPTDDSIGNLKPSTRSEQQANREMSLNRELPVGVYYKPRMKSKPYVAVYKGKHIGIFATSGEAHQAYLKQQELDN